ncbi:MAG TPA: amidohydrolase family protein [Gemmatimonadaceae bacterium]
MDARALAPPPLPVVKLPPALETLIRERASRRRDPDSMRSLFTEDAVTLSTRFPTWETGIDRSVWAVGWFPPFQPYVLRPAQYRMRGQVAQIMGYYMDAASPNEILGFFDIDAELGRDGQWRISSEAGSFPQLRKSEPLSADDLIKLLDEAGIRRAVILSNAYFFDGLVPIPGDDYANVRAENDWTAEQVAKYPDRLVAFCSFNPTREHASRELDRCAKSGAFKGVKLHLGTSPVDLDNPVHVAKTRKIFEQSNRLGLPLLLHLTASPEWGKRQAEIFLNQLVTAAPDVQVVVAHLWGGAWYNDEVLSFFADAVSNGRPGTKNLYFEVSQAALITRGKPAMLQAIATHMRRIGLNRMYYGSDTPLPPGESPKKIWEDFRKNVPLTDAEFRILANNVAPWAH